MEPHTESTQTRRSIERHEVVVPRQEKLPDTVARAVSGITDGVSTLVRGHLALARAEMAHDLKALGKDTATGLGGVPLLLVGYLLLWMGVGYLIALALPAWASFFICAGANFLIGGAMIAFGSTRLKKDSRLDSTVHEVRRDREWIHELRERPGNAGARVH